MTLEPWETLADETLLAAGPWFRVRKERVRARGAAEAHDWYMIDKGDFATVVALTDAREVVLTRQYRHGVAAVTLDLPSGYVEPGEDADAAIRRELREETGYEATAWSPLGSFTVDANRGAGRAHMFLATGARRVAQPEMDGDLEEIEVLLLPLDEAMRRVRAGEFRTLAPVACLALAASQLHS